MENAGILHVVQPSIYFTIFFSLFTFVISPFPAFAQDDDPSELAPPPLKIVTKEDRAKLNGEADAKVRTKLAVEMMKSRVSLAESLAASEDFDGMFRELGHFRGLLDYMLDFLDEQDARSNKTLDNYKRVELSLRSVTPRLETIRREIPLRYEDYVRKLLIYIRDARRKALEPLFSDTVLPNKNKNE